MHCCTLSMPSDAAALLRRVATPRCPRSPALDLSSQPLDAFDEKAAFQMVAQHWSLMKPSRSLRFRLLDRPKSAILGSPAMPDLALAMPSEALRLGLTDSAGSSWASTGSLAASCWAQARARSASTQDAASGQPCCEMDLQVESSLPKRCPNAASPNAQLAGVRWWSRRRRMVGLEACSRTDDCCQPMPPGGARGPRRARTRCCHPPQAAPSSRRSRGFTAALWTESGHGCNWQVGHRMRHESGQLSRHD